MSYSASDLSCRFDALIDQQHNAENVSFERIDCVKECDEKSLVFVDSVEQLPKVKTAVIVTNKQVAESILPSDDCVLIANNVRLAQAKIKQAIQEYDCCDVEWGDIHPTATVHPSAQLGTGVRLGPNVVIGADVKIGNNTQIRANSVIEHGAIIGSDGIINTQVNIGYKCELGDRVNIHSGVVIGNEGFGFAQDTERNYHRIPHTGIVKIGDDVQIGANSNIDRGTYLATIIANGVKLDALCHVAHNVHIDEGSLFASQACIAGSTYVGKRVMASGQVGILDHLHVADNTVLVHRSGVTSDIQEAGMYAGLPAKPFKEYVKSLNLAKRFEKLSAQVKALSGK